MKQFRGQAEVGVLRGRGDVDLQLGWGGVGGLYLTGSLWARPHPLWAVGQGSGSPITPSGGCPSGAKA